MTCKKSGKNLLQKINFEQLADIVMDQCDADSLCDDDLKDIFLGKEERDRENDLRKKLEEAENGSVGNDIIKQGGNPTKTNGLKPTGIPGTGTGGTGRISSEDPTDTIGADGISENVKRISSFCKKRKYINVQTVGPEYSEFIASRPIEDNTTFVEDPLRGRLGAYWSIGKDRKKVEFLRKYYEVKNKSHFNYRRLYVLNKLDVDYTQNLSVGFLQERYELAFKRNDFITPSTRYYKQGNRVVRTRTNYVYNQSLLNAFAVGGLYRGSIRGFTQNVSRRYTGTVGNTRRYYSDINYSFCSAFSRKELESVQSGINSQVYDVIPDYVFYIKQYEKMMNLYNPQEWELPNMYTLISSENYETPSPDIYRIYNLGGKIKKIKIGGLKRTDVLPKKDSTGQYYDEYSLAYPKLSNRFKQQHFNKQKNILVMPDEIKNIMEYNNKKVLFPMHVQLRFSADKTAKFSGILKSTKMLDKVIAKICDRAIAGRMRRNDYLIEEIDVERINPIANPTATLKSNRGGVRYLDLFEVISEIKAETVPILNLNRCLPLGDFSDFEKMRKTEEKQFIDTLYFAIFKDKTLDFLNQTLRSYLDVLLGKTCYTETIMYRIAKYKGTSTEGEPLQNIFIPNDDQLDMMEYIDTQVKYDQEYTYVVYSYEIVVGNKYKYENVTQSPRGVNIKNVTVRNEPDIKVVEIPFFQKQTRVYDSPPPPPDIDFAPYKDKDNKMLFLFNSSANTYKKEPVLIRAEDEAIFRKVSEKQEVDFGEKIEFSADDQIAAYEIYRMEQRPKSYQEFADKLLLTINTDVSLRTIQEASSAAFVDNIISNKKYYYMFRSIDIHGKPSNPTDIYELEMINEKGTIFPLINSIDLEPTEKKEMTKPFKRFIQITPASIHTILNEQSEEYKKATTAEKAVQAVKLGVADNPLWGKKFKLRLVSKQTKKVIDLDIKFDFRKEKIK